MSCGHQRIIWIDYAKAIGIFLVILGHVPIPGDLKWWIYGMHMPLFFIISGYLNSATELSPLEHLKRIANSLLVPYVIYAAFISIIYCVIKRNLIYVLVPNVLMANYSALVGEFTTICPLWFLVTLATIKLLDIIKSAPASIKCLIFTIIAIGASLIDMTNIFMIKTTILCLPFYYIGVCLKTNYALIEKIPLWGVIVAFSIFLACSRMNGMVNLTTAETGRCYILFLISGSLGSISFFEFLRRIFNRPSRIVETISGGTLLIMSVHYLMIKPLTTLIPSATVCFWLLDSLVILGISYGLILISKRYCPVLLGKQKIIK